MVLKIYGDHPWNNLTVPICDSLPSKGGLSPQLLPCLAFSNPLPLGHLSCVIPRTIHTALKKKNPDGTHGQAVVSGNLLVLS